MLEKELEMQTVSATNDANDSPPHLWPHPLSTPTLIIDQYDDDPTQI